MLVLEWFLHKSSKGAITMNHSHSNTNQDIRKSGKHLSLDERGMIQALHREGLTLRAIAKRVGCSHTTIYYELKRGTPERTGKRGPAPKYTAKRGQMAYESNLSRSRRYYKIFETGCHSFLKRIAAYQPV